MQATFEERQYRSAEYSSTESSIDEEPNYDSNALIAGVVLTFIALAVLILTLIWVIYQHLSIF